MTGDRLRVTRVEDGPKERARREELRAFIRDERASGGCPPMADGRRGARDGRSIDGRKPWSPGARRAHHMIAPVRTAPRDMKARHAGLTQFLIDPEASGIDMRGIRNIAGARHFDETVFDGVFMPDDMGAGDGGDGGRQAASALAIERSGPGRFLSPVPVLAEPAREPGPEPEDGTPGRLPARPRGPGRPGACRAAFPDSRTRAKRRKARRRQRGPGRHHYCPGTRSRTGDRTVPDMTERILARRREARGGGFHILKAAGARAEPAPPAETPPAGGLPEQGGADAPGGAMTVAPAGRADGIGREAGALSGTAGQAPFARDAGRHVALLATGRVLLVEPVPCALAPGTGPAGRARDDIAFDGARPLSAAPAPGGSDRGRLQLVGAATHAARMAAPLSRPLGRSVRHAREREQFDRPWPLATGSDAA